MEKDRREKMQVGKSRFTVFFQWFGAPEGRKVTSLKRRAEPPGQMRDEKVHAVVARSTFVRTKCTNHLTFGPLLQVEMSKKCTPLWRKAHFEVKMYKARRSRTTFGSSDVEKVHAIVARSRFPSQNVQSTSVADHFWKFRCRKSARGWGAKHITKSKCTKHVGRGPLLEVQMSKKCTPLWREAHYQVKMYKARRSRTTFGSSDVEKVHAVVARSTFPSQKCEKLRVLRLFWHSDVEKVDTD